MERVYAYTDESGAFGWDLDNPSVSTHFIISAIIVKESERKYMHEAVESIRKKYFQTGEIKSSHISSNHTRREKILSEVQKLPFTVFSVVFDKQALIASKGLRYKQSFYKFLNNIVHRELRRAFPKLTIVADEIGGNDYMQSFSNYVRARTDIPSFFGDADFLFENSKNDVLIQLADLISGSIAYCYDKHKSSDAPNFVQMLGDKISRIEIYPKTYETYSIEKSALAEDYDKDIATICLKQAVEFISTHENDTDQYVQAQVLILQYLLFRFMNNDTRKYIPTKELQKQLENTPLAEMSLQQFRAKIIAKLRDGGVIISGSRSKKGYKIPSKKSELADYIDHDMSIILPMFDRLKKCRDLIKLGTHNEIDLFDNDVYNLALSKYFEEFNK